MKNRVLISAAITCALGSQPGPTIAAPLQKDKLQIEFQTLTRGFDGRVGICAQDETGLACANGDQQFSLQSVMKLLVGLAVMDAVDHRGWRPAPRGGWPHLARSRKRCTFRRNSSPAIYQTRCVAAGSFADTA